MRWLLECAEEPSPTPIRQLQDSLLLLRAAVEDTILFANRLDDPRREDVKAAAMKAAGEANESQEWKAAEDHLSGKMPKSGDFAYETRLLIATIWDGLYDCWQGRKVRPPLGQLGDWRAALDQRLRALQAIGEPAAGATRPQTNPPMHPTSERIEPGNGATPGAASHSQGRRGANGAGLAAIVERANTMWDRLEGCQDGGRVSLFAAQELFGELITILRAVLDSLPNDPTLPISSEVEQICHALKAAPLDEVAFCFGMLGQSSTAYTVFVHNPTRATAADALAACTDVFWAINAKWSRDKLAAESSGDVHRDNHVGDVARHPAEASPAPSAGEWRPGGKATPGVGPPTGPKPRPTDDGKSPAPAAPPPRTSTVAALPSTPSMGAVLMAQPTTADLCDTAGLSRKTFARIREEAGLATPPGGAGRKRTFTPAEVDRLINAARERQSMAANHCAQQWAKWSTNPPVEDDPKRPTNTPANRQRAI